MIKNCTPHDIKLNNGKVFRPCGIVPRCSNTFSEFEELEEGVPVCDTALGDVVGLPAPQEGVYLLVSSIVASACPNRTDLIVPGTNHPAAIREKGQVISVPCFTRIKRK